MDDTPHPLPPQQILTTEVSGHLDCGSRPSKTSPANTLPDDVLAYLFSITSTSFRKFFRPFRDKTIRAVSQVCVRWRSVALSYPRLWSSIDYRHHSLPWIKELLRRSDPVVIDFGSRSWCMDLLARKGDGRSVVGLVLKHVSRIRVFHFAADPPTWELLCSDFLQHPAPNLEFFSFSVFDELGGLYTDTLFSNHAPKLQTFHVHRCAIDFHSPVLSQLTGLHVAEINSLPNALTVLGLLELLQQMPSLRWLTLIRALSSDTPNVAHPTIRLDSLKMLSIEGSFQETVMFITHILTPPLSCLRLRCSDVQFGSSQQHLWTSLQKMINCWEIDVPDHKLLAMSYETSFAIGNVSDLGGTWEKHDIMVYDNLPKPKGPILTFEMWPHQAEMIVPLVLSVLTLFEPTLPTTTELWLDYRLNDETQVFLPIIEYFRLLTRLETLKLTHNFHTHLFPLLKLHSGPGSDSMIFPELRILRFVQSYFRMDSDSATFARDYMEWRRRLGFPIEQVEIYDSQIDRDWVELLFPDIEMDLASWNDCDRDLDTDEESSGSR